MNFSTCIPKQERKYEAIDHETTRYTFGDIPKATDIVTLPHPGFYDRLAGTMGGIYDAGTWHIDNS